ncbi:MAG: hypothetical protein IPM69_13880 [Ignavibacteria bacterium]|nr:hypothetical protein [Ignavibacteria bacterium]
MKQLHFNVLSINLTNRDFVIHCLLMLIISLGGSQKILSQQVEILSPSKYGVWNLTDVEKLGDKDFMCGDGGLLLSGNSNASIDLHERIALPDIGSAMLVDIDFNSTSNGIIIATGGIILNTNDNAKTWTKTIQDSTDFFTSVNFVSETHAIITAMNGTLYKSINSGIQWSKIKLPVSIDLRSTATKNNTTLVSGDIGFIAKSTDLGSTWTMSSKSHLGTLYSIAATDNAFIIGGSNGIYYSEDDGATWKRANQPNGLRIKLIKTLARDAFAVSDSGFIYRSGDDGKNWSKTLTPNLYSINGMLILSNTTWLNVGENSNAKHTSNNGGYYQDYLPPTTKTMFLSLH